MLLLLLLLLLFFLLLRHLFHWCCCCGLGCLIVHLFHRLQHIALIGLCVLFRRGWGWGSGPRPFLLLLSQSLNLFGDQLLILVLVDGFDAMFLQLGLERLAGVNESTLLLLVFVLDLAQLGLQLLLVHRQALHLALQHLKCSWYTVNYDQLVQ